jgi:GTP cyclohydrolase III
MQTLTIISTFYFGENTMLVQTDFFSEILTFIPQSTSYKLYLRWAQCLYHTGDMDQATHSTVFRYSVKSDTNLSLNHSSITPYYDLLVQI